MLKHAWNLSVPAVFVVIVVLYLIDIGNIRGLESYYPLSVAITAGGLAVASMWRDRLSNASIPAASDGPPHDGPLRTPGGSDGGGGPAGSWVRNVLGNPIALTLILMGVVAVTIYLMTWLGFFVPSVMMVAGAAALLGVRVWWKLIVYSIAVVGLAYLLFVETLNVPFPSGPWG